MSDTHFLRKGASITAWACVGGKKEREGPLCKGFDETVDDNYFGQSTWEAAETALQKRTIEKCLQKAGLESKDLTLVLAGDLECQTTATNYAMRALGAPFAGLYGACSTMAEALALGGLLVQNDVAPLMAVTGSHFAAAERQYRTPLEYGGKRTTTAQWTVTGCGAALLGPAAAPPYIRAAAFGRVTDLAVTDINNMGAAMAPAAANTLLRFFADNQMQPDDFDCIYTGDLGLVGSRLLGQLLEEKGVGLTNHKDCGLLIYDTEAQNVQAGGSGAGCSASVLCAHILPQLQSGALRNVLFAATGALMSQTTFLQGESIPGIAHLVWLSHDAG